MRRGVIGLLIVLILVVVGCGGTQSALPGGDQLTSPEPLPTFSSAPTTPTPAGFTFTVNGDNRPDSDTPYSFTEAFRRLGSALAGTTSASASVWLGDYIYADSTDTLAQLNRKYDAFHSVADQVLAKQPGIFTPGNHEYIGYANPTTAYQQRINANSGDFVKQVGGVYFVSFNTFQQGTAGYLSSTRETWLKNTLASLPQPSWIVVLTHEPVADPKTSDPWAAGMAQAAQRSRVMGYFKIYGVDLVVGGHRHNYRRHMQNGVSYVTVGMGGVGGSGAWSYEAKDVYDTTSWGAVSGQIGVCWLVATVSGDSMSLRMEYERSGDGWVTHEGDSWTQPQRGGA